MNIHIRNNVTVEAWNEVCRAVGLDPDVVLKDEADLSSANYPGRLQAYRLLKVMVRSRWKLIRMNDDRFEDVFASILGVFITAQVHPMGDVNRMLKRFNRRASLVLRTKWLWRALGRIAHV